MYQLWDPGCLGQYRFLEPPGEKHGGVSFGPSPVQDVNDNDGNKYDNIIFLVILGQHLELNVPAMDPWGLGQYRFLEPPGEKHGGVSIGSGLV